MRQPGQILYFGCRTGDAGHFCWAREWSHWRGGAVHSPVGVAIDTGYAPNDPAEPQGEYSWHLVHGWSIVAWWDRSVDTRGKCNSAFLVGGPFSPEEVIALAGPIFPSVLSRQAPLRPHRQCAWPRLLTSLSEGGSAPDAPVAPPSEAPPAREER